MHIAINLPGVTPRGGLLSSTAAVVKKEVVYTKFFHHPDHNISLRPFCIARDMPVIYNWAWKISRAANMVAASYMYTGASDFARSFMVLLNNRIPLCQVDICNAAKDELYESYHAAPGDYILRFLLNTKKKKVRPLHVKAVQTCMEYFLSFAEVKQLIAEPEAGNKMYNDLLRKAGFTFKEKAHSQYTAFNVYACPRDFFQHNYLSM